MVKTNPKQYSTILFPFKAYQLLLEEYASQRDSKMKQEQPPTLDDEYEDFNSDDGSFVILDEYDSGNESDDSEVKGTLLYNMDLQTEIVRSFGLFLQNNTFNIQQIKMGLPKRYELLLNEVIQQLG
jgi:hypothetical protein